MTNPTTKDQDPIERIARALFNSQTGGDVRWENLEKRGHELWRKSAHAAITAMQMTDPNPPLRVALLTEHSSQMPIYVNLGQILFFTPNNPGTYIRFVGGTGISVSENLAD